LSNALVRIPVGVIVERRKAKSAWIDFVWRPVAVLAAIPETKPWTPLQENKDSVQFYVGDGDIELHLSDTGGYRDNLANDAPLLWIVLRPTGIEPPYKLLTVTADPSEGEAMTEPGTDLVEPVPMPDLIRDQLAAFVAEHHVEQPFIKRKRNRADPESMGRRSIVSDNE
jgi:hypothetical protein